MKKLSKHKQCFNREKSSRLKMILDIYAELSLWSMQNEATVVLHGSAVML